MDRYAIVETDNYAGDYPDEKFVEPLPFLNEENANKIADSINSTIIQYSKRFNIRDSRKLT